MGLKKQYHISDEGEHDEPAKVPWYYAFGFAGFWFVVYFLVTHLLLNQLPVSLTRSSELSQPDAFIAERAEELLLNLTRIGPRVVGSDANENTTVEFLSDVVAQIAAQADARMRIELDVQLASGAYMHWQMINMYQGIQNVVVKLSNRETSDDAHYLLVNAHYDTVPFSPGAGDDGAMVANMLEVLRVLATSGVTLKHPIVFLFNGAEENPLQGSHAFITQHKWAKHCRAVINLDACGAGGREALFQSGPNHPWLVNYYGNVPHPFANTLGEEIFQANFIPSDTDFRIFRNFGQLPGLDIAYIFNGYVYHTKFDQVSIVSRDSLQNTGDNLLALTKSLANAPELADTQRHAIGNTIFFDFFGYFTIFYTETTGTWLNVVVSLAALVAIGESLCLLRRQAGLRWSSLSRRCLVTLGLQLFSLATGCLLTYLVSLFMDGIGRSLSWFSNTWLILGLYFAPVLSGMCLPPALYLQRFKADRLPLQFRVQLFLHAHCALLAVLALTLTALRVRSAYMVMLAILFYLFSLLVNLVSKLQHKGYWFAVPVIIGQILPFSFFAYLGRVIFALMIPMQGRSGSAVNPEVQVALLAMIFSLVSLGFIMPLFFFYTRTRLVACSFLLITFVSIIIALTDIGFPYRAKTSVQRYSLIHAQRTLRYPDGRIREDESGIYIYPQDRRTHIAEAYINKIGKKRLIADYCADEMFCGLPLYNHRWSHARNYSFWIPIGERPALPANKPNLTLIARTRLETQTHHRLNFTLSGPDHMTILVGVELSSKLIDWSFDKTLLEQGQQPPYFIYFSCGLDKSPLEFHIDVQTYRNLGPPALQIGVAGHWIHEPLMPRVDEIAKFPDYAFISYWLASYETTYF